MTDTDWVLAGAALLLLIAVVYQKLRGDMWRRAAMQALSDLRDLQ